MTDRRPLLLLTNRYPFGSGEEYLEHEIRQLVRRFDRVVVLPCMPPNTTAARAVPDNVVVVRYQQPDHRRDLPRMLWRGHRGLSSRPTHPVHRAYDSYFEGRAQAVADAATPALVDALHGQVPAVIYSYWFYITARVGIELRRRLNWNVALVSRAHGYDVNVHASPARYLPQRPLLLEGCDRVHPVSDAATRYLQETYPSMASKVATRRLGTPEPPSSSVASRNPVTVVTCSMIRPLKRLDLVRDAVAILRERGHDVRWTHFGSGPRRQLDRLRGSPSDSSWIDLRGYVPNAQIFAEYQALAPSVFINASTSEGVPVSVMEAMGCGIPVLATDVGGTRELLGPLDTWALLPADLTAEHLAAQVESMVLAVDDTYAARAHDVRKRWESVARGDTLYADFADELLSLCP